MLDVDKVLMGLHCCAHKSPDCENCPYSDDCRNMELESIQVINMLKQKTAEQAEYINELEEMVGMPHE